ncbi:hypothetical protein [Okeania sp. SIO2B9]|uniref:hypothetical protein n=1 Tax=Okeania sp. SIO2B9 TaxID=2607782 RepID=UPI00142BEA01|nr:hypothetical protein [Okeania sp. SIO2B9]NES89279.1 hypothetical protein [Okeania sp. SIO2B9]
MPATTQEVLNALASSSMPSSSIANSFNITGYENNMFLKDWCMLINGLFLINREFYRNYELAYNEPRPAPYNFSSPTSNSAIYTARIDLYMDDFNTITNSQRDSFQPFNGVTAQALDMNSYTSLFGSNFAQCPWLVINFDTIAPMQFALDTAKIMQELGEPVTVTLSNRSSVMLAAIRAEVKVGTPQVPQYEDILVA